MTKSDTAYQIDVILRKILAHAQSISCDDCYDVLDKYADMLRAGKDPSIILPGVKEHLIACGDCGDEFKALIAILETSSAPDTSNT